MKRPSRPFAVEFKGSRRIRPQAENLTSDFLRTDTPQPFVREEPRQSDAMRAAEAVFSRPPDEQPSFDYPSSWPSSTRHSEPAEPPRRILEALDTPDPLKERLQEVTTRKRGRPRKVVDESLPIVVRPRGRPRKNPETAPRYEAVHKPQPIYNPQPVVPYAPQAVCPPSSRMIRQKWVTRVALAPGERWKRRLPKCCW